MTAQEYLSRYINAQREERRLERLIARTRDRLDILGFDMSKEKIQASVGGDRFSALIAELVDFKKDLEEARIKSVQMQREIERVVEQVENARQRELLSMRYLEGMPWRDVAQKMGYAYSWIFKIHRNALDETEKVVKSQKR